MSRGWFGNREKHRLASKGIRSTYRRLKGDMLTRQETWVLRDKFIENFGYYNDKDFEEWVLDTTDKTPFYSSSHAFPHISSPSIMPMGLSGKTDINKDNVVNYIMAYEDGSISEQGMIDLFAYLVESGMAWTLQGHYGRTAKALIDHRIIDKDGNVTSEKYGGKPVARKVTKDKDLQELYDNLWDVFDYRGREFTQTFYSGSTYSTEKYPMRSKEIIWEDEDGNQIYLFEDTIEYIPFKEGY